MRPARKRVPPITPPAMAPSLTLDVLVATADTVDTGVADDDVVPIVAADEVVPVVTISEVAAVVDVDCVVGSEDVVDGVDEISEGLVSAEEVDDGGSEGLVSIEEVEGGGDDLGGRGGIFHS